MVALAHRINLAHNRGYLSQLYILIAYWYLSKQSLIKSQRKCSQFIEL